MASLFVLAGPAKGRYYPLGQRTIVIGRDENLPVQIVDATISGKHMQIRFEPRNRRYLALDMKSTNGVFVGGTRIVGETPLMDGDIIQLGNSELQFTTRDFPDEQSAFQYHNQPGQRGIGTLRQS